MLETQSSKEFRGDEIKLGLYAGNAEISDTVNLLILKHVWQVLTCTFMVQ